VVECKCSRKEIKECFNDLHESNNTKNWARYWEHRNEVVKVVNETLFKAVAEF